MAVDKKIESLSPDDLLRHFSKSKLWIYLVAATLLHVVLLGALGVPTVRGWVDPDWKAEQEAKAKAAAAAQNAPAPVATEVPDAATTPQPAAAAAAPEPVEGEAPPADPDEERIRNSDVYKAVTETASPEEIPDVPLDLGISIEETNR